MESRGLFLSTRRCAIEKGGMVNFRQSPQISPTPHHSQFTMAAMSQYSLNVLRRRYVVEKRPLEAKVEQILRADARAGARAILASIDKRRSENRSEGQRLRKMLRFETSLCISSFMCS